MEGCSENLVGPVSNRVCGRACAAAALCQHVRARECRHVLAREFRHVLACECRHVTQTAAVGVNAASSARCRARQPLPRTRRVLARLHNTHHSRPVLTAHRRLAHSTSQACTSNCNSHAELQRNLCGLINDIHNCLAAGPDSARECSGAESRVFARRFKST